jgi:hypothetical protein
MAEQGILQSESVFCQIGRSEIWFVLELCAGVEKLPDKIMKNYFILQ